MEKFLTKNGTRGRYRSLTKNPKNGTEQDVRSSTQNGREQNGTIKKKGTRTEQSS